MSAIPVPAIDSQLKRLYEIAQEYRANGYDVIVGPSQHELPEFLRGFEPDLIVISDDDRAVVEVKNRRAIIGYTPFAEMAQIVEQHPDWRLELVLVPSEEEPEEPLPDAADIARIRALLANANQLRESSFAIVPAFAAVEQALLVAARRAGLTLPSRSPVAALKTLFAHGVLSKDTYDQLDAATKVRYDVVHGVRTDVDARPWLAKLEPIVETLLGS